MSGMFAFRAGRPVHVPAPEQPAMPVPAPSETTAPPDQPRWVEQCVAHVMDGAMACHAAKRDLSAALPQQCRLLARLRTPALFDHPKRPGALVRLRELDRIISNRTADLIESEVWADHWWRRLTPEIRAERSCALAWEAAPDAPTLIGQSWRIWPEYPLPADFTISRDLIPYLEWSTVLAYNAAGLLGSEPLLSHEAHVQRKHALETTIGTPNRR